MLVAAAPVFAGEPVIVATPAPVEAQVASAPQACPWSYELGVSYAWASTEIIDGMDGDNAQTVGVDLTACYAVTDTDMFNIRFGYGWGDAKNWGVSQHFHTWTLMPGYRYTCPLDDTWSIYAGVNVGVAAVAYKQHSEGLKEHCSGWGFAYSAELGVRYALCPDMELFLGYIFSGNTAEPSKDGWSCAAQNNHGIRAGVGVKF